LISLALPWWGVNGLNGGTLQWTLFSTPSQVDSALGTTTLTRAFSQIDPLIVGLVILTAVISLFGSFAKRDDILLTGFGNSLFTSLLYVIIAATSVTAFCQSDPSCGISGPFGSTPLYSWGFELGYYLFIAAAVVLIGAMVYQKTFVQPRSNPNLLVANSPGKFCTNCGKQVSAKAKFCAECGQATEAH
jgi:zinc ribbon protein